MDYSKRFYLFICESYYPKGGMDDLEYTADTVEECTEYLEKQLDECGRARYHIFDTSEKVITHRGQLVYGKMETGA